MAHSGAPKSRFARRAIVAVLAGVLINVVIAWACALWMPVMTSAAQKYDGPLPSFLETPEEAIRDPRRWQHAYGHRNDGIGVRLFGVAEMTYHQPVGFICELRAGWPWSCLSARIDFAATSAGCERLRRSGWEVPGWIGARGLISETWATNAMSLAEPDRRLLPHTPVWAGMIGGSAVYAGAIGLFWIPGAIRKRSRRRRGACEGCGYDLAGMPVCSECGRPGPHAEMTA